MFCKIICRTWTYMPKWTEKLSWQLELAKESIRSVQGETKLPFTCRFWDFSVDLVNFQLSFSDEHTNLPAGQYTIKLYDDDSYSVLRKVSWSLRSSLISILFKWLLHLKFLGSKKQWRYIGSKIFEQCCCVSCCELNRSCHFVDLLLTDYEWLFFVAGCIHGTVGSNGICGHSCSSSRGFICLWRQ